MSERRILTTWKQIAAYLSRGIRTAQRWELSYGLPVRRAGEEASVYAFADEIDAWLQRMNPRAVPYVRPTFLVVDVVTPSSLSNLKLAIEAAKFNVLTAFTSAEVFATAAKFNVDGFIIDSVVIDMHPADIGRQLRERYPQKPRILVGEDPDSAFDMKFAQDDVPGVVEWLLQKFGKPRLDRESESGLGVQSL